MSDQFDFDVFISYSTRDAERVSALAKRLSDAGLAVWIDRWKIVPGDSIPLKIEEGLQKARTLLLCISANSLGSEWVRMERSAVMFRDPTNEGRRFIPIKLDDAELPETLRQFAYVDWRRESVQEYERLIAACKPMTHALPRVTAERQLVPRAFQESIVRVAASQDGSVAITASPSNLIGFWDVKRGRCLAECPGHSAKVNAVAISADGTVGFSCSDDATIAVWDIRGTRRVRALAGHRGPVTSIATNSTPDKVVAGGRDGSIRVWDVGTGQCVAHIDQCQNDISCVTIDRAAKRCVIGTSTGVLHVWDVDSKAFTASLAGHAGGISAVAMHEDGSLAVTASSDRTLRVWNLQTLRCIATLEGHTKPIEAISMTPDGLFAASSAKDKTIRIWDIPAGECLAVLEGHTSDLIGVSITSDGRKLISGATDHTMRVWDLATGKGGESQVNPPTRYTNAKVLLVGQSGVGKTGLSLRLTEGRFEASISSDAVWATQMQIPYSNADRHEDKEIWLWDFAGQSDYRLIHQIFMDETALALLVFNPQVEDPFEGLTQWDSDIRRAAKRTFRKILVAGRCDRGGVIVSKETIQRFVNERGFSGFIETSASTGKGCQELKQLIIDTIPWNEIPWTTSPRIFRLLKAGILSLRDQGYVLIRLVELKQQLELGLGGESFSVDQLRAVIGLLTGPGVVRQLEFGDFVLLKPEYVNTYASAVIRTVRSHVDEIGAILEQDVISAKLKFEDMVRLPADQESIVLREMHQMFIDRGLCLREHSDAGELLIFPSYFKRERPDLGQHPAPFIVFGFSGALDEIYATLVVRLLHTAMVVKESLWKWAADFCTHANHRVGMKMLKKAESTADLAIYIDPDVSDDIKLTFVRFVYDHLRSKDPNLTRVRYYVCPHCGEPMESLRAVEERKKRGLPDIPCSYCETRIPLMDLLEEKFQSPEVQDVVRKMDREVGSVIDNESKELILVGHAFSIAGEAGQIFRPTANSDWGIDGEIEFKDENGIATGARVYLQLKSGDSYLRTRRTDGKVIFRVANERHLTYWTSHSYPVMLVVRTSDGQIQWMDVSHYLRDKKSDGVDIEFEGEAFNAASLLRLRDKHLSLVGKVESLAIEAGHKFRTVRILEWGIDGEIELLGGKSERLGFLSLQLRPEVSYVNRGGTSANPFIIAAFPGRYGQSEFPKGRVMLVRHDHKLGLQSMDVSSLLRRRGDPQPFEFKGVPLTTAAINQIRDELQGERKQKSRWRRS